MAPQCKCIVSSMKFCVGLKISLFDSTDLCVLHDLPPPKENSLLLNFFSPIGVFCVQTIVSTIVHTQRLVVSSSLLVLNIYVC